MSNLAILLSVKPQFTKMIMSGEKNFEFRTKIGKHWKKGVKVYVYESKGKKIKCPYCDDGLYYDGYDNHDCGNCNGGVGKVHEGVGAVVCEYVIGEIYRVSTTWIHDDLKEVDFTNGKLDSIYFSGKKLLDLYDMGYTNQRYAIEITNIIIYDKLFIYNCMDCKGDLKYECKICKYSRNENMNKMRGTPIPLNEFVRWNKKCINIDSIDCYSCGSENDCDKYNKISISPKQFMYVLEKRRL